eukprot:3054502-Rhodomonas_salina.4
MPWLMPAVQVWFQILLQYKGITENVNANFVQEYSETLALGLRTAGAAKLHICKADSRIKHHLNDAQKVFASVEAMC